MNWRTAEARRPAPVEGNTEREQLLIAHLPQVQFIARRIHDRLPAQVALEDLVHTGVVGLIDAIEKYDPGRNVQFKFYANFRIRGAILDSLREMDWAPRQLRRRARRIDEAHRELELRLGRVANEAELATELRMSLEELQQTIAQLHELKVGSLESELTATQSADADVTDLFGMVGKDPFSLCLREEMWLLLRTALDGLKETEKQVMILYYLEERTMKEVGLAMGLGESRVSQIHSSALVRVRARLDEILRTHNRIVAKSAIPVT